MQQALEQLRQVTALMDVLQTANAKIDLQSGLVIVDSKGAIIYMSPGALGIFKHPKERVIGESLESLIPERYHSFYREELLKFSQGKEEGAYIGRPLSLVGLASTGEEIAIMLKVEIRNTNELGRLLVGRVYSYPDIDRSILLRVEGEVRGRRER